MTFARISVMASCVLAVLMTVIGCGGEASSRAAPSAVVQGTISFSGAGVAKGTINFMQSQSGFAASTEINNGAFKFADKLPTGNFSIFVTAPSIQVAPEPGKPVPKLEDPKDIPAKDRVLESSPLNAELKSGANDLKLEMVP